MTLQFIRSGLGRNLSVIGLALCFAPAAAQVAEYDPYRFPLGSRSARDSQQRPGGDRVGAPTGNETERSTGQVQTDGADRFRPDEIDTRDREPVEDRSTTASSRPTDEQIERYLNERGQIVTRRLGPPNEFERFASEVVDKPLRRFGSNLLVPDARSFAMSPVTTVPSDYRINPGDRLVIGLIGSVNADNLRVTVDSDGRIFIPRVGAVRVAGVRFGDLQSTVAAAVSRQYRSFQVSATVEQLRGITVYVTGFAATPGSYNVTSLSTLVNAVLAAGGPSAGGSFRSIQLRRGGRLVSDFDLYDFLLRGDKSGDSMLQNGDVIYIAPVGAQVAVIGSVNNEAIFEARPTDSLTDVLLYAGGANTAADTTRLLSLDPLDPQQGWQQLTPEAARATIARRAQVVRVLSSLGLARPLERQNVLVTVDGEVAKPGRYFVSAGTPIASVLQQAGGLTSQAYPFGTVFRRDSLRAQQRQSYDRALRDLEELLTTVPLTSALPRGDEASRVVALRELVERMRTTGRPEGRLVLNVTPDATAVPDGLVLENNDALFIPARPVGIGVFGSVPSAATYQYRPDARIRDYLDQAGGVTRVGDRKHVFVVRANGTVFTPRGGRGGLNARALPGDLIFVPINPVRGEFWARLQALAPIIFGTATTAATLVAVTK